MKRYNLEKNIRYIPILLFFLWIGIILYSWLASAAGFNVESLLSADGIRWAFSHIVTEKGSRGLVYLLILIVTWGTLKGSGILSCIELIITSRLHTHKLTFRQRHALLLAMTLACIWICVMLIGILFPHALLLNVTGEFLPSPFLGGFISGLCLGIIFTSISFASLAGTLRTWNDYLVLLTKGIGQYGWLILSYMFGAQVWKSFVYMIS
jgi:p-aminobenzoyl-glutamate transporter AbgT